MRDRNPRDFALKSVTVNGCLCSGSRLVQTRFRLHTLYSWLFDFTNVRHQNAIDVAIRLQQLRIGAGIQLFFGRRGEIATDWICKINELMSSLVFEMLLKVVRIYLELRDSPPFDGRFTNRPVTAMKQQLHRVYRVDILVKILNSRCVLRKVPSLENSVLRLLFSITAA